MKQPISLTFLCLACLASGSARAVWEYSLAQKMAMFDAIETICRPVDKKLFDAAKGRLLYLTNDEKAQMDDARQSNDYAEILQEVKQELSKMVVGDLAKKRAACKKIVER